MALAADVVDLEAMEQAVSDSVDHFGKVDVVIANAGITPLKTTARAIDADDWEKVVEVNVMGVWRTIRAGLPAIKKNGGQAVIISSSYAHVNGIFNSSYAVSKAAVEALGRALQIELACSRRLGHDHHDKRRDRPGQQGLRQRRSRPLP